VLGYVLEGLEVLVVAPALAHAVVGDSQEVMEPDLVVGATEVLMLALGETDMDSGSAAGAIVLLAYQVLVTKLETHRRPVGHHNCNYFWWMNRYWSSYL